MVEKVHIKIPIPGVNEYPFEKGEKWAKWSYRHARAQVSWRRAKEIKIVLPIETADYAEKMTFGKWRLIGEKSIPPTPLIKGRIKGGILNKGGTKGGITLRPALRPEGLSIRRKELSVRRKSPLETVLKYLKPYIDKTRWGQFRREFTSQLKIAFTYICNTDYNPTIVKQMNDWINKVLAAYCHAELVSASLETPKSCHRQIRRGGQVRGDISCHFVLHPETVEYTDHSPVLFKLKNGIWKHYTGRELNPRMYLLTSPPGPDSPRQMEMHLDLEMSRNSGT